MGWGIMADLPWFRFYSEAINDPKFRRIARNIQEDRLTVIGAWVVILSVASRSPERGMLYITHDEPYSKDDVAELLGWNTQDADMLIGEFIDMGMMEIIGNVLVISNWKKRQYESDSSASRVKKYRDKKRYCNVTVTSPDTESDSDTESDKEIKKEEEEGKVFKFYSQNFGNLTPGIADTLNDFLNDYPVEWILEAMKRAIQREARNLAYVRTILEDWRLNGFQAKRTNNGRGKSQQNLTLAEQGYTDVTAERLARESTP